MELFRVFPHDARARPGRPGHPLFVPREYQGAGRWDNPELYAAYYLSASVAGAVGERFGTLDTWVDEMFLSPSSGLRQQLGRYALNDGAAILDLDDAATLVHLGLRPSEVVASDRDRTRPVARAAFATGEYAGLGWWSYYRPEWRNICLWDATAVKFEGAEPLTLEHPAIVEAAALLRRRFGR